MDELKIQSDVAGDDDKEEFLNILKTGEVPNTYKSKYAINFKNFKTKIDKFCNDYPMYTSTFPQVIMRNCILLPIEADKQETALRIFSTLNDRGMPLSDADIFKAQFYKYYSNLGKKQEFITRWRELESLCSKIFHSSSGSSMDELFTRYMYFERARQGNKQSTTEALRKFYEKEDYKLLKSEDTFNNLEILADFWSDIINQDEQLGNKVLRDLFVLNYAPNGMWNYFLSVYFMQNKDTNNKLDLDKLHIFLKKVIGFVWGYAFTNPGVNALRTPIYAEMINIVNNKEVNFDDNKFDGNQLRNIINNYNFINQRPITKSMLTFWAFTNNNQKLINLNEEFQIEHIFAKRRYEKHGGLSDEKLLEKLGNKSLLESDINSPASDCAFRDKKPYYYGQIKKRNGKISRATQINDLIEIADKKDDFVEQDIIDRNNLIIDKFIEYLEENNLIK